MFRRQQHLPISMRARHAAARAGLTRAGFTLVEMMVAVMILTVGLLGMVSTSGHVVRQVTGGRQQTVAANVVQSRLEWMRTLPCASYTVEKNVITRGVRETWRPGATVNNVLAIDYVAKYPVNGIEKKQELRVMIPCR
jgi:prepilin-type N-terminal cleavage/methylation domain-containing protein